LSCPRCSASFRKRASASLSKSSVTRVFVMRTTIPQKGGKRQ
jgi:hypothetical protein